jgi:release factor glutamine methyltransferase
MRTVGDGVRAAVAALAAAGIPTPARDARVLMATALGVPLDRMSLIARDALPEAAARCFEAMVVARAGRQPVAQIVGERDFWGRRFRVTRDVLDPRPETETLIAAALEGPSPGSVLDLGTGSGAILVTLLAEWPAARGLGIDASTAALAVAAENARRHGVADRAEFRHGDWADPVEASFDLVVCNPPYVAEPELASLAPDVRDWEPRLALTPGPTGLEAYAHLAPEMARLLAPGGRAFFEIGADQGRSVPAVFAASGVPVRTVLVDLDGRDRVVVLGTG